MSSSNEAEGDTKGDLGEVPVLVKSVTVNGVQITNDNFLKQQLNDVFLANTFLELLAHCSAVERRLVNLEIFKTVECVIDLDKENRHDSPNSPLPRHYSVQFFVKERKRMNLSTQASCGMENNVHFSVAAKFPNLLGRAINVETDLQRGTGGFHLLSATALFPLLARRPWIQGGFGVTQSASNYRWAHFMERGHAMFGELRFPSILGKHQLRLETQWKSIRAFDQLTPAPVREACGDYLKPSLRHIWQWDSRDDSVFPLQGTLLKSTTELAGNPLFGPMRLGPQPGPTTLCHWKQEFEAVTNVPLSPWLLSPNFVENWGVAMQCTLGVGVASSTRSTMPQVNIADRFYVGGALSLRGFELRSLGPRAESSSGDGGPVTTAALGNEAYFISGLHLYSALPYIGRQSPLTDAIRLHAFVNAGNAQSNIRSLRHPSWMNESRLSAGFGLVLRLGGIARIEMHYCVPFKWQSYDKVVPGFQMGFGVSYL